MELVTSEREQGFAGDAAVIDLKLWIASADGSVSNMTPWLVYTGQSPEEIRGWGWLDAIHPDDRSRTVEAWRHAAAAHAPYQTRARVRRADGVYRWVLACAMPCEKANGHVPECESVFIDITDSKQVEDDLRARNTELEFAINARAGQIRSANELADVNLIRTQVRLAQAEATNLHLRWRLERVEAERHHLRAVLEATPDAMVMTDQDGYIMLVNQQTETLFGYQREDLVGQPVEILIPERYHAAHREHRGRCVASPRARPIGSGIEVYGRRKDGTEFPAEVSLSVAPGTGTVHLVSTIRDVSARKRSEAVLQQTQQEAAGRARQLEAILATLADGVLVVDEQRSVVAMNHALRAMLGLSVKLGGFSSPESDPSRLLTLRDTAGQPIPEEQNPLRRVLQGAVLMGAGVEEYLLRTEDARDIQVSMSGAPLRGDDGRITGGVLVFRDVTEQRWLERRTHDSLTALLAMAEILVQAPEARPADTPADTPEAGAAKEGETRDGIGRQASSTVQWLVELARSVLGGERLSLIAVDMQTGTQRPMATIRPTAEEEQVWWASVPRFRVDDYVEPALMGRLGAGEVVLIDLTKPPGRTAPDRPTYGGRTALVAPMRLREQLVGLLISNYGSADHEVTGEEMALAGAVAKLAALVLERERLLREREMAQAHALALEAANQHMDEFLVVAAHELRAPVTVSTLAVQMAASRVRGLLGQEDMDRDEPVPQLQGLEKLLARADHSMARLGRLMTNLLDVARIRAEKLELHIESCDLVDIVRDAIDEQRQLSPTRTIALHVPARRSVPVVADAVRIGQVFTNYLSNALKYSAETLPIVVQLQIEDEWVRVSVRDKGPGLSAEQRERVWERFYRVPGIQTVSGNSIGLGLGLYICKTVVELHQGQVGVLGAPGKGSIFWFRLPLAPETS
jgi:PAS domain S-box-containing protein